MIELNYVAIIGGYSSGKSDIVEILAKRAGYFHVSGDKVRKQMFPGKDLFELNEFQRTHQNSNAYAQKHLAILDGKNVVFDGCPINKDALNITMGFVPGFKDYLVQKVCAYLDICWS